MDEAAERISQLLGSAPSILVHLIWWGVWWLLGGSVETLVLIVSLEAIIVTLFVLRAENVQSKRTEKAVKEDLKKSGEHLKMQKKFFKELRDQRYLK